MNFKKSIFKMCVVSMLILVILGSNGMTAGKMDAIKKSDVVKNFKNKVSYSIGLDIGDNLNQQKIEVDMEILFKGIFDGLSKGDALLSEEEVKEIMMEFQKIMKEKYTEEKKKEAEENRKEGEKFLTENKKKKDVKTLKSGLQYKVITKGKGKLPTATDIVKVHYKGTFIDGTEFDSSYKYGKPVTFPVSGVIKGWTEALQLMKEGSKWELVIPSELAYGEQGAGYDIGPNTTLLFTVELISIEEKKEKEEEKEEEEGK